MNLKYYLRGLGLGIIVTAVIMGAVLGGKKEELSDEDIIIKAKALGMVEDKVLSQYGDNAESEPGDVQTEQEEVVPNQADEVSKEPAAEPVQEEEAATEKGADTEAEESDNVPQDGMSEDISQEENSETEPQSAEQAAEQEAGESTLFTIRKGDGSHTVSQRLAEAGVVSSAKEFDQFLIQNGYDKKIVAADFEIPAGADFETISKIITGR